MSESIFTKIINGEIPSHKVYEDDKVIAILDIHPVAPGHTMVITKKQVDHVMDLDDELYLHSMKVVKDLSNKIYKVFKPQRMGLVVMGLDVPHAHIHLIPMHGSKEISIDHDMGAEPDHESLAEAAAKLK